MTKCIEKFNFANLAELRDAINYVIDSQVAPTDTILPNHGAMTMGLHEETLTDGSKVYNFGFAIQQG